MASFFEISVIPEPVILATKLSAFQYSIRSFREPLDKSVREVMVNDIKHQFAVGGDPPWAELADSTREVKEKMGLNRGILIRTGALERAATQISQWKVTSEMAYFAGLPSGVSYGYPLDSGFMNARTGTYVPAREFIRLDDNQRNKIADIFDKWVDGRRERHLS